MNYLKLFWSKWISLGKVIGNFNAQVILTIVYIIAVLPLGLVYRIFADPLNIKLNKISRQKTNFHKWEHLRQGVNEARKQY